MLELVPVKDGRPDVTAEAKRFQEQAVKQVARDERHPNSNNGGKDNDFVTMEEQGKFRKTNVTIAVFGSGDDEKSKWLQENYMLVGFVNLALINGGIGGEWLKVNG